MSVTNAPAAASEPAPAVTHGVCPWWLGPILANPVRRLFEKPERILGPFVAPGMTVLEPGCGMGFFTVPLARLVGPSGRIVCVDLQPKMLEGLRRRARRAGVLDRIETIVSGGTDLRIDAWAGRVDVALAIHVVHELPDPGSFLRQLHRALRPAGTLVISEPKGHVTEAGFADTIALAERVGFTHTPRAVATRSLAAVFARSEQMRGRNSG
jgi:ubiquinone/menaquinone biosynthesis C-methylase UbiE